MPGSLIVIFVFNGQTFAVKPLLNLFIFLNIIKVYVAAIFKNLSLHLNEKKGTKTSPLQFGANLTNLFQALPNLFC